MKRLLFLTLMSISFSQISVDSNTDITHLEIALENASRTGQKLFLEEFSGLT